MEKINKNVIVKIPFMLDSPGPITMYKMILWLKT